MITKDKILEALSYVDDPDLKKDLVTLGMIKDVEVQDKDISFTVVLTTPACPLKAEIEKACRNAIIHYVDKDANITIKMDAKVTAAQGIPNTIKGIKNIIAISSGKGGVGKSTISANLAIALAQSGAKVGLLDADIFGPSIPIMFGLENEKLFVEEKDGKSFMVPAEKHDVKLLSIGFLIEENQAVVWRGPMASKALRQLFEETIWGELDYLLIDLPPGTSDIHLTLASSFPLNGAVVVSTPQKVALADAKKGIQMFNSQSIKVPVLGVIENMSFFTPDELPDKKYYLFGRDGAKDLAQTMNLPFLGEIPLQQQIREGSDYGRPAMLDSSLTVSQAFREVANNLAQQVAIRNATFTHNNSEVIS